MSPASRMFLHSAVQPEVNALGNQASTTAFLPAKSASEYSLPSEPVSLNSGAWSPTFGSAWAILAIKSAIERAAKISKRFMEVLLAGCVSLKPTDCVRGEVLSALDCSPPTPSVSFGDVTRTNSSCHRIRCRTAAILLRLRGAVADVQLRRRQPLVVADFRF